MRRKYSLSKIGIFIFCILLCLCACNPKASSNETTPLPLHSSSIFAPTTVSVETMGSYVYTPLQLSGNYSLQSILPVSGNLVYIIAVPCDASGRYLIGENGVIPQQILQYDLSLKTQTSFCYQPDLNGANDVGIYTAALDPGGSLWCLVVRSTHENENTSVVYTLEQVRADGTVAQSVSLNCPELHSDPSLQIDAEGNFLLFTPSDGFLTTFNASGEQTSQIRAEPLTLPMVTDANHQIWMSVATEEGTGLNVVGNPNILKLTGVSNGLPVLCSGVAAEHMLYISDDTAIYSVSLDSGAAQVLTDLTQYGVEGYHAFHRTENGSFVFLDASLGTPVLAALCPGQSSSRQKIVLTLATANPTSELLTLVPEFNRSSEAYQVEVLDFSSYLDSGSYSELFETWGTAIAAGDLPDMIDFSNLPWHSFADRGLLLDLNTILPRDDILPWLWEAISYNGSNYTFPGCFLVETLIGKQSKLEYTASWNITDFLELANTAQEPILGSMDRDLFIFYLEQYLLDEFIDEGAGTCSFDSEEFQALLEFSSNLTVSEEAEFDLDDPLLLLRRDMQLVQPVVLSDISQMHSIEAYTVGEPVAWIGWPGQYGTKIKPAAELAAFANAEHLDGVTEFLRFLLSETSQQALATFMFPMTSAAFEADLTKAMAERNANDPDLATEITVDGTVYPVVPLTQKNAVRYLTFLEGISAQIYYPWDVGAIIEAECAGLWTGKLSPAETAMQIQDRVALYLKE